MDEFFLSSESSISAAGPGAALSNRWMIVGHSGIARPALVLVAGDQVTLPGVLMSPGKRAVIRYGAAHTELSHDGAELLLELIDSSGNAFKIGSFDVPAGVIGLSPRQASVDLGPWAGSVCSLRLSCGPGPANDPRGDWIAIYDIAIGSEERMGALRALAFREERTANEIAHFANVYSHPMYHGGADPQAKPRPKPKCVPLDSLPVADVSSSGEPSFSPTIEPPTGQYSGVHEYAHHLLSRGLKATAPNFVSRLADMCQRGGATADRPLRVLSLCAGAARIEAQFSASAEGRAHWTLLDISSDLLESAAANFPENQAPRLLLGDVNEVRDFGERFDVVMCVSGLHHVVDLEKVLDFCRDVLKEDGEFWSIGEAIGRSGNRLFDDDYRAANNVFRALPPQLRRNRNTGRIDTDLPNVDYSDATFEGIRSDEIEPLLFQRFEPIHVYRRNCFLWRLVDLAYADNYNLAAPADLERIHMLVDAELRHFRNGGRPTELHGAFRKRLL